MTCPIAGEAGLGGQPRDLAGLLKLIGEAAVGIGWHQFQRDRRERHAGQPYRNIVLTHSRKEFKIATCPRPTSLQHCEVRICG